MANVIIHNLQIIINNPHFEETTIKKAQEIFGKKNVNVFQHTDMFEFPKSITISCFGSKENSVRNIFFQNKINRFKDFFLNLNSTGVYYIYNKINETNDETSNTIFLN